MTSTISLTFPCTVCGHEIRGEYEEEDFDYPVFCPKCGRQNRLPAQTAAASVQAVVEVAPVAPAPSSETAALQVAASSTISTPHVPGSPPPVSQNRGRIAWRFRPASSLRPIVPLRNCVAVDDRGCVIAALGPDLFALSPGESNCELDWKFTAGEHIPGSPVICNEVIYVHSSDGALHAIGANGSPTRPPTRVGPALGWATPLVDERQCVWISASTGGLVRVDSSGQTTPRPFFRHPSRLDCTGALRGDVLYVGSEDQFLHAIDLQGDRGRDCWNQVDKVGLTGWYINSAIALMDSSIIAVSRDDQVYSFDQDGKSNWSVPLEGRAIGSPIIAANGVIVIGLTTRTGPSDDLAGRLVGIHAKTGQFAWRTDVDAPIESTPVAGDANEIYVGDNLGRVHAVNVQGQRLWSESVGSAVRSAGSILPTGQVVFGLDDGSLVALRCSSRALSGPWPKLLATPTNRGMSST